MNHTFVYLFKQNTFSASPMLCPGATTTDRTDAISSHTELPALEKNQRHSSASSDSRGTECHGGRTASQRAAAWDPHKAEFPGEVASKLETEVSLAGGVHDGQKQGPEDGRGVSALCISAGKARVGAGAEKGWRAREDQSDGHWGVGAMGMRFGLFPSICHGWGDGGGQEILHITHGVILRSTMNKSSRVSFCLSGAYIA